MKKTVTKIHAIRFRNVITASSLCLLSNAVFAEEIGPLKGASDWLAALFIGIAFSILAPVVMYGLWQFYQGHKDAREVVKPILVTALIVSVPSLVLLAKTAIGA